MTAHYLVDLGVVQVRFRRIRPPTSPTRATIFKIGASWRGVVS